MNFSLSMDADSYGYDNRKGIVLMLLSALTACIGQLCWKFYALQRGFYYLVLGFCLYALGALLMIVAYRFGRLSVLQPLLSVSYLLSVLIGYFILNETLTGVNLIGVCLIGGGVILIARSD